MDPVLQTGHQLFLIVFPSRLDQHEHGEWQRGTGSHWAAAPWFEMFETKSAARRNLSAQCRTMQILRMKSLKSSFIMSLLEPMDLYISLFFPALFPYFLPIYFLYFLPLYVRFISVFFIDLFLYFFPIYFPIFSGFVSLFFTKSFMISLGNQKKQIPHRYPNAQRCQRSSAHSSG